MLEILRFILNYYWYIGLVLTVQLVYQVRHILLKAVEDITELLESKSKALMLVGTFSTLMFLPLWPVWFVALLLRDVEELLGERKRGK